MDEAGWWSQLGRFWERSTGGADVAARPADLTSDRQWPTVPRAAGVDEACNWLKEGLSLGGPPRLLFLVGGPGAGKSHAAAEVVNSLNPLDSPSGLAQRTYYYAAADQRLTLINDATISSDQFQSAALSQEIDAAIANSGHFLGCVNRGVLVEELAQLRREGVDPQDTAGGFVVGWLHSTTGQGEQFSTRGGWSIEGAIDRSYIRAGRLNDDSGLIAEILVVFVDVNSLFETTPAVVIDGAEHTDLQAAAYTVEPFENRRNRDSSFSPAGALFSDVVTQLGTPVVEEGRVIDPLLGNLQSLQRESVRRGVLSVLRAAEVVSGQRMTFREVWGALSRCLIGSVHLEANADDLEELVRTLQPLAADSSSDKFAKLRVLAQHRFSEAIFGASKEASEVNRDPVLRLTHRVDPVLDAVPGRISVDRQLGWSSPISDAFSGEGGGSPLAALLESPDAPQAFLDAVTEFDRELDSAYMAVVSERAAPLSERDRHEATRWYGAYLTRFYAVVNGIPAFRREVGAWTTAWKMAPNIPALLEDQLATLLKPLRYPSKGVGVPLFPVFESRTNPIQGNSARSRIAIRSKDVQIRSAVDADSLFVSVKEAGRDEVAMLLDFAMIREAMACGEGFSGVTELSDATSPRLERFRAARLVPGKRMDTSSYRIVSGSGDTPLTVEESR